MGFWNQIGKCDKFSSLLIQSISKNTSFPQFNLIRINLMLTLLNELILWKQTFSGQFVDPHSTCLQRRPGPGLQVREKSLSLGSLRVISEPGLSITHTGKRSYQMLLQPCWEVSPRIRVSLHRVPEERWNGTWLFLTSDTNQLGISECWVGPETDRPEAGHWQKPLKAEVTTSSWRVYPITFPAKCAPGASHKVSSYGDTMLQCNTCGDLQSVDLTGHWLMSQCLNFMF